MSEETVTEKGRPLSLRTLRLMHEMSQTELSPLMFMSRPRVSVIERQSANDLYVRTIRKYVEALGGRLELSVVFDDGFRVPLKVDKAD